MNDAHNATMAQAIVRNCRDGNHGVSGEIGTLCRGGVETLYGGKPATKFFLPDGSVLIRYASGALAEVCGDCLCRIEQGHERGCTAKHYAIATSARVVRQS